MTSPLVPCGDVSRPLIGLTAYREPASWGVWRDRLVTMLPTGYTDSVRRGGGVPVLLPPGAGVTDLVDDAAVVVGTLAGLILTGGPDVDPGRYDQDAHPTTGAPRLERDAWEFALLAAALDVELPVFAICRGLQVLNVGLGGTLHQHLPDVVNSDLHAPLSGAHGRHTVRIEPSSRIGRLVGSTLDIATSHHQGVDRLGSDLVATAWADDGIVEAVEHVEQPWVVGVQWHPEIDGDDDVRLFEGFAAACRS